VLVVDDFADFRHAARRLLEAEGFSVVGEAGDGESALRAARELSPDIVLLDIQLPGIDGFEVARRLASEPRAPAIILTSARDSSNYRSRLSGAPAQGFIGKSDLSAASIAALL
jgi:DNA-binding NarL/FixJ family response regulator